MKARTLGPHFVPRTASARVAPPLFGAPHRILRGIWRVADPKITLASVASMLLGTSLAAHDGRLDWLWLVLTVLGIFAVEAAKNASGDVFDWDSGTDQRIRQDERSPFSGGKRVIVDGLLTRGEAAVVAFAFYASAAAIGLSIVVFREPSVMLLGVIGMGLAYYYHAPPLALSYHGLGEAAVALAYGPIIACGTYLVQRHTITRDVLVASVPLGLAIAGFLFINEFPDARADALSGKRTLVVRLGRPRAARAFCVIVAGTYLGLALLPLAGLPLAVWLGFIGLPLSIRAAARLLKTPDTPSELVPAQAFTLVSFVLLALGASIGVVLSR